MKLIVGLGNPGEKYKFTRHNLGSLIVEKLTQDLDGNFKRDFFAKSKIAKIYNPNRQLFLMQPLTYMNLSGKAVVYMVKKRKISLEDVLVICDDTNLEFGKIRIKPFGSEGGHNGLKSITESLRTQGFPRLRIGIGSDSRKDLSEYVLENFTSTQKKQLDELIEKAIEVALCWLDSGIQVAMNKFN